MDGRIVAWIYENSGLQQLLGQPGNVFDLTPPAILLDRPGVKVEGPRPENYTIILLEANPRAIREVNKVLEKLSGKPR